MQPKDGSEYLEGLKLEQPWPSMVINEQSAEEVFVSVLENAGAVFPKRDAVDIRVIDEVLNGFATYEGETYKKDHKVADKTKITGIIDTQEDVGGWPVLKSVSAPIDTDRDGMPDEYEKQNGLNSKKAIDGNEVGEDGYTMLENYLNSILSNRKQ
ncbi:hypothetical protein [uncultured Cyclobacterium sp.]|uniref:hypothetical protein n=1 Tax=uncultured Cyclobacterium sp. TaxID=453820 RepID=UPI0030ED34F2